MNKKISDMMDYIEDDTVEMEIADMVSPERVKEITMKKLQNNYGKRKKHCYFHRMIASAAAVMLMFSVAITAMAYPYLKQYENPMDMIKAFFGQNGVSEGAGIVEYDEEGYLSVNIPKWERVPVDKTLADELIAPYISGETGSKSYKGYTLTAEANLFDESTGSGLMYFTLENSEGISGYEVLPDGEIWWNPETIPIFARTNFAGKLYIDNQLSTNTKLYLCEYYVVQDMEKADVLSLVLGEFNNDEDEDVYLKLHSASGNEMVGIELEDGAIKLSPIGIKLDKAVLGLDIAKDVDSISFQYADGTEYILEDDKGFVSNSAYVLNYDERSTYMFNRIVDIDSLVSVTIEDMIYHIN